MKITIDTKEDSHDEIKKVIKLLETMVEASSIQSPTSTNLDIFGTSDSPSEDTTSPDSSPSASSGGMFDMFGSSSKEPTESMTLDESSDKSDEDSTDTSSVEEIEDSVPEVQLY